MPVTRLEVRVEQRHIDEFDAAFADRVLSAAVFLPARLTPVAVDVGAWVRIELLLASGVPALSLDGVVAWRHLDVSTPPGREPGLGIAVVAVDAWCHARFAQLAERGAASGRLRLPGVRLLQRLHLPHPALPPLPSAGPAFVAPALVVPRVDGERLAVLESLLAGSSDDTLLGATLDSANPLPSGDDPFPADAAPAFLGEPTPADGSAALPPFEDKTPPGAPALAAALDDDVDEPTHAGGASAPPSETASGTGAAGRAPVAGDAALLADAPVAPPGGARAFEPVPTDVDVLASIAGEDVVSLDPGATGVFDAPGSLVSDDLDDLPSMDAQLLDVVGAPSPRPAPPTRALPPPPPRSIPDAPPTPAGPVGVAFMATARGVTALEEFSWSAHTTKRGHPPPPADDSSDSDVFAASTSGSPASSTSAFDDPFAPRPTDPGLSVDGVVARAVRAAQAGDDADDDVFGPAGAPRPLAVRAMDADVTRPIASPFASASNSTSSSDEPS